MKGWISRLGGTSPVRLARAYGDSKAGQYAASLAFNAFMTMFPLMLGILAIMGWPGEEGLVPSPGDQLQDTEGSRAVEDQRRVAS